MNGSNRFRTRAVALLAMAATAAFAQLYSIPVDQMDSKKVFWGAATGFEKAGEVDYEAILKATPEVKQVKREKIERGTGKYWILMSQASDRSTRAIVEVGQNTEYDLIAVRGYLASLTPAIPADDLTKLVLNQLEGTAQVLAKGAKKGKDALKGSNRTAKAETKSKSDDKSKSDSDKAVK